MEKIPKCYQPESPDKVKAYNHKPIDGIKPVIPNIIFRETYDKVLQGEIEYGKLIMEQYALDITQKNLLQSAIDKNN